MNVVDLQDFYASPLGKATHRLLAPKIVPALKSGADARILGLGYATPYLLPVPGTMAFMMARRGVMHWPSSGVVHSALVDEYDLPLPDHSIDIVLVVHGLEFTDDPDEMLQELWRVLAPQGKLILVVPNRHGLWSLSDKSPFGFGQPFSAMHLMKLLKTARQHDQRGPTPRRGAQRRGERTRSTARGDRAGRGRRGRPEDAPPRAGGRPG